MTAFVLERETRFELATFALARRRSTTEPFPHLPLQFIRFYEKTQAFRTAFSNFFGKKIKMLFSCLAALPSGEKGEGG